MRVKILTHGVSVVLLSLLLTGPMESVWGAFSVIAPTHKIEINDENRKNAKPSWKAIWDNARQAATEQNLQQARELYQALLKKKPNIVEARWEYCKLLILLQDWKESAQVLEDLLELEPNNLEFLIAAGEIALKNKHFHKAIKYYGQVYEADSVGIYSTLAIKGLVKGFKETGKEKSAFLLLEQYYQRSGVGLEVLTDLASLSKKLGYIDKSRFYYAHLAEINPSDKNVLLKAAEVHDHPGHLKKASVYWLQYLKLDENYLPFHRKLSQFYLDKKSYNEALPHLIKIYSQDHLSRSLALDIGNIYNNKLNRPDKALVYYERYNTEFPGDIKIENTIQNIRDNLAVQYLPIVENDAAKILWKDLDLVTLNKQGLFFKMADLLHAQKKTKHEIAVIEILYQERKNDLKIAHRLAQLYIEEGQLENAYDLLLVLEMNSYSDKSYLITKADIEIKRKEERKSLNSLVAYLDYDPNNRKILGKSIHLAGQLGLIDTLFEIWQQAPEKIKNKNDFVSIRLEYIEALQENGLYSVTDRMYSDILKELKNNEKEKSIVYFHLADSLLSQGLVFEAEQVAREVLAKNINVNSAIEKLVTLSIEEEQFSRARSWLELLARRAKIDDIEEEEFKLPENIHFLNIDILLAEKNYSEAEDQILYHQKYLENVNKESDFNYKSDIYLARIYFLLEEYEEFQKTSKKLSSHPPAMEEVVVLADIINTEEKNEPNIDITNIQRPSFISFLEKSKIYSRYNRNTRALKMVDNALHIVPESVNAQLQKIKVLSSLARYQEALQHIAQFSRNVSEQEYVNRLKLQLEFKSGNFKEIVKQVPLKDDGYSKEGKHSGKISEFTYFWKKLLLARALWADNKRSEAIKVYDSLLTAPVDNMFLEKMEVEKINFNLPPLKKSFWNMITFTSPSQPDPISTVMDPQFVAQNIGQPVDDIAASMYGKYRWQKLVKKELSARQAIEDRDYYRAEKEYLALLKEEKSEETLFDLAYIYNKLGHYGKEAELYEIVKQKGPLYPGLDEYIQANVLKRQPRVSTSYTDSKREGRDGYVNLKKRTFGLKGWLMPSYDQEISLGLFRNLYSSFDRKNKYESNRLTTTYSTYFKDLFDLNVGFGADKPLGTGTTEILYKFEMIGRFNQYLEGYGRFEQELVEDTVRSVTDSVIYRDFETGIKYDVIPRLFLGADYRFRMYSDDNQQNRYKLWSMYHLFGEMNQFKIKYSYENIRHNSENIGRDDDFRAFFLPDDRVYWSPNHHWQHLFSVHYKHLFEISRNPEDPLNYFSFDYSYGYEEDFNQIHGFDMNIFLEMDRHFLLKGNVSNLNGDDFEETLATFSLIYRW